MYYHILLVGSAAIICRLNMPLDLIHCPQFRYLNSSYVFLPGGPGGRYDARRGKFLKHGETPKVIRGGVSSSQSGFFFFFGRMQSFC